MITVAACVRSRRCLWLCCVRLPPPAAAGAAREGKRQARIRRRPEPSRRQPRRGASERRRSQARLSTTSPSRSPTTGVDRCSSTSGLRGEEPARARRSPTQRSSKEHSEVGYLGIDVADTPDEGKAFVERYDWSWPSIQDPQRDRARSLGADYQPHFILVDATGDIVDASEGGGDEQVWNAMLAQLP